MAGSSTSRTIEVIFRGVDEVSGTLQGITSGLQGFSDGLQPVAELGQGILKLEAAFAGLAGGAITAAIVKADAFKSGMNNVNSMLGLNSDEMARYSQNTVAYATGSTQSMKSIQDAMYEAVSLGVDYKDSLAMIDVAEKMAVAGKADLAKTLVGLKSTMNAYGAGAEEAAAYSDAFFVTVKDGKTTIPELAQSLANATGIAAAGGVNFDTLGAAIAAMTAGGKPTAEAITQIRAALEGMINPSAGASKAAAAMGIDLSAAALKSKGFAGVLKNIYQGTGGSIESLAQLFTSSEALQAVLSLGADSSGAFAKAMEHMANKAGATTSAFNIMKDNAEYIWQNMLNNWENILVQFGLSLGTSGTDLIQDFTALFQSVAAGIDNGSFDPILEMITGMMASIGETVSILAINLPEALKGVDFTAFVASVQNVGLKIKELFGIDLSSTEGIRSTIQGIVDTMTSFQNVVAGMIDSFIPIKAVIMEMIQEFNGLSVENIKAIGSFIGWGTAGSSVLETSGQVIQAISSMVTVFAEFPAAANNVRNAMSGVSAYFAALPVGGAAWTAWVRGLQVGFVGLAGAIGYAFGSIINQSETVQNSMQTVFRTGDKLLDKFGLGTGQSENVALWDGEKANKQLAQQKRDEELSKSIHDNIKRNMELTGIESDTTKATSGIKDFKTEWDKVTKTDGSKLTKTIDTVSKSVDVMKDKKVDISTDDMAQKFKTIQQDIDGGYITMKVDADTNEIVEATKTMEQKIGEETYTTKVKMSLQELDKLDSDKSGGKQIEKDLLDVSDAGKIAKKSIDDINRSLMGTDGANSETLDNVMDGYNKYQSLTRREKKEVKKLVSAQLDIEKKLAMSQVRLTDAQADYLRNKSQAMTKGEGLIKIDAGNLSHTLQLLLHEVLEEIQIKASESVHEYLFALPEGV